MMVVKKYIEENLKQLDRSFTKETDEKKAMFFSKLAILELCGWIELSMDEIILNHCKKVLKDNKNIKSFEGIVRRNHGFSYDNNFSITLIRLIGYSSWENIEKTSIRYRKQSWRVSWEI